MEVPSVLRRRFQWSLTLKTVGGFLWLYGSRRSRFRASCEMEAVDLGFPVLILGSGMVVGRDLVSVDDALRRTKDGSVCGSFGMLKMRSRSRSKSIEALLGKKLR